MGAMNVGRRLIAKKPVDRPQGVNITMEEFQELSDKGRIISVQDDGEIHVIGEEPVKEQPQPVEDDMDMSEGNELTGFSVHDVNDGKNELTDFDPGQMGQSKGGNDLIDFK